MIRLLRALLCAVFLVSQFGAAVQAAPPSIPPGPPATRQAIVLGSPTAIRAPNTFAWVGTSRIAAQYIDQPGHRNKGNAGFMNWTAGTLRASGKPILDLGNFATSGYRTDQFAAGFAAALATGAANLVIDGPVNDIGQNYPTGPTVVAAALANLKGYIKRANDAGVRVFYVWERGAAGFTATQVGYVNDFNRQMADYLAAGDDFRGVPNVVVLDPTPYSVVTSNAFTVALKNSPDGTHDNVKAAKLIGFAFADKIAPYLRELPGCGMRSLWQANSALGTRALNPNPGMAGSHAAAASGNSGSVPSNWIDFSNTGVSAAFAIQATAADANGNQWGNEVKITATATQAGQVGMYLELTNGAITAGDFIRGGVEIDVASGATGLAAVRSSLEWYPASGGTIPVFDMIEVNGGLDDGGYSKFQLAPGPLAIGPFTGVPYTNVQLQLVFSGAGSAVVTVRKAWAERSRVAPAC